MSTSLSFERLSAHAEEITIERVARENRLQGAVAPSARLPEFIGAGKDAIHRLAELALVVVGVGSVGRRIALGAARMQPRSITLVDPARVKPESLLTHPVLPQQVGEFKALRTALDCKAISPSSRIRAFCGRVEELDEAAFADASLACMAGDNLSTEVSAGELFMHFQVPLVHVSVHGETLVAQVRFFDNRDDESPCPACGFGPVEWGILNEEAVFRCDGSGTPGSSGDAGEFLASEVKTQPTMSTAFLCSLAASLGLTQITRHVLGLGQPVGRTMLSYCGYTHQTRISPLKKAVQCPCEHLAWTRVNVEESIPRCTLREVASVAGVPLERGHEETWFAAGNLRYFETGYCCGLEQPLGRSGTGRFGTVGGAVGVCSGCGGTLRGDRFRALRSAPASGVALDTRLADLGAASVEHVVIRFENRGYLVRGGGRE